MGLVTRCMALLEKKRTKCDPALMKKAIAMKGK